MEHVGVRVEAGEAGMRLDQLLAARLPDLSRSRLRQLIDAGAVLVGGAAAKASLRPRAGVQIEVSVPDPRPTALMPEDLRLPVLYQDGDLVVIDKPARAAGHPGEGRRAVTRFRVLGRGGGAALAQVELLTGRTHQIRAHFADAGFPLLGDALYGGRKREARLRPDSPASRAASAIGRQALHAAVLGFAHPVTGAPVRCAAPLPADFRAALRELGIRAPHPGGRAGYPPAP